MRRHTGLVGTALALGLLSQTVDARDPDPMRDSVRAQERLDRELQRTTERAQQLEVRTAEERLKIQADAIKDPEKAAGDLAKLDADTAREQDKIAQDQTKAQDDFAEDVAKATADAEDHGSESQHSEQMRDLGKAEDAEHDADGFPVRRGEVVALDLAPATLQTMMGKGYRIVERRKIEDLGQEIVRLAAPRGVAAMDAKAELRRVDPAAVVDLVHYYGLNMMAGTHARPVHKASAALPARRGNVTVGMIDTAVSRHPSLQTARIVTWSDGAVGAAPTEHGTAVASLLAGEGSSTIYAANIFRGGADRPFTSADVIAEAIGWMLSQKVGTVNMSLAGPRNAILDRLIRDASAKGLQVVAAAGNGGPTAPPAYPAALPSVIAVTAVDKDERIYRYANRGRYIAVAARGVDVTAAQAKGGLARFDGTSFATPHITAWIARCRSSGEAMTGCKARLQAAARDAGPAGFDDIYGHGVVD